METFKKERMKTTYIKPVLVVAALLCLKYASAEKINYSEEDSTNNMQYMASLKDEDQLLLANETTSLSGYSMNLSKISYSEIRDILQSNAPTEFYSFPMKIFLSTLATTASVITVAGNLLVIFAFFIDRQIRNPTNYFLLSLSLSDLMIGLFSMPLYTLYLMLGVWPFGKIICNLWLSLDYTVCLTSIYTVLLITIDRFCSVKIPAKYRKWRSRNKIVTMILLTWIIPVILWFAVVFISNFGKEFDPITCELALPETFNIILICLYFWLTLFVMIILYCFIYQVAKNLEKKSRDKALKFNQSSALGGYSTATFKTQYSAASCKPKGEADDAPKITNSNLTTTNSVKFEQKDQNNDKKSGTKREVNQDLKNMSSKQYLNELKKDDTEIDRLLKNNPNENSSCSLNHSSANNDNNHKPYDDKIGNQVHKSSTQNRLSRYTSFTSKDEEYSSSYDSQSECEKTTTKNKQAFKEAIKKVQQKAKRSLNSIQSVNVVNSININTIKINANLSAINNIVHTANNNNNNKLVDLKPRPETLAVLSTDDFSEKCSLNRKRSPSTKDESSKKLESKIEQEQPKQPCKTAPAQIPFIEDDYEEVSYILHRRKFVNKEINKEPVSEETIIIKKGAIFQTLSSPEANNLKNLDPNTTTNDVKSFEPVDKEQQQEQPKTEPIPIPIPIPEQKTIITINSSKDESNEHKMLIEKDELNSETNNSDQIEADREKNTLSTVLATTSSQEQSKGQEKDQKPKGSTDQSSSVPKKMFSNFPSIIKPSIVSKAKAKAKTKYENRARKALRTITFILGAFVFSWVPFHTVSIIYPFCQACSDSVLFLHFFRFTYFLCYLNSPINPFCYALANQQFKKTFSRILKGDWRRT